MTLASHIYFDFIFKHDPFATCVSCWGCKVGSGDVHPWEGKPLVRVPGHFLKHGSKFHQVPLDTPKQPGYPSG